MENGDDMEAWGEVLFLGGHATEIAMMGFFGISRVVRRVGILVVVLGVLVGTILRAAGPVGEAVVGAATASAPATQAGTMPRNDLVGLPNFAQVSEGLYRGAQPTAAGFTELKKMGIKTVVNLRAMHSDRDKLRGTGLQYAAIPCDAWHPEEEDVAAFLKVVIDPANRPVFVHCQHGADRTGMMTAAYRMVEEGWTAEDAMAELPRFGFHPVFKDIQKYLKGFDVERVRKEVGEVKGVEVETVK